MRLLVAAVLLMIASAPAGATQFYATQGLDGDISVVDESGLEVPIATADPVGERPGLCPYGSYYVAELPTDRAKLVLTDCATGLGQYDVELKSADN
jgi:hypothetical protein